MNLYSHQFNAINIFTGTLAPSHHRTCSSYQVYNWDPQVQQASYDTKFSTAAVSHRDALQQKQMNPPYSQQSIEQSLLENE